ncbi:MAG: AAA family ATPase [Muribaculaceae bacterium]|nr:AAA family ATPase [Muribaculaceae bacterium]
MKRNKSNDGESLFSLPVRDHAVALIEHIAQGLYEKRQIVAMALLCAVAGENIFLLGPPGTAKSLVASRLKTIFKNGKSFDYLMSRFSTPDEIFGPVSISRLKNDDVYERLTEGYLPEADVVFLDEIWKAGPSIQNTLLTVINEHLFYNGSHPVKTPMKVLIAAGNELPAPDEGLEALWDRFLVRMVSNCIKSEDDFVAMIQSENVTASPLDDALLIDDSLYKKWQAEAVKVEPNQAVIDAVKSLRRKLVEKEDEADEKMKFYVSDRRWRKFYRLMQVSAMMNGRSQLDMSDYLLSIHCLWNDVDTRIDINRFVVEGIGDTIVKRLEKIDTDLRLLINPDGDIEPSNKFKPQFEMFTEFFGSYYGVQGFPDGTCLIPKWDYAKLDYFTPSDGIQFVDATMKVVMLQKLMATNTFEYKKQSGTKTKNVKLQMSAGGVMVDGVTYQLIRKDNGLSRARRGATADPVIADKFHWITVDFNDVKTRWQKLKGEIGKALDSNIFLSSADRSLIGDAFGATDMLIEETTVRVENVRSMLDN